MIKAQCRKNADIALTLGESDEACPLGLAPTSSTTATLVLGDALAVALLEARGFTADDLLVRIQQVRWVNAYFYM